MRVFALPVEHCAVRLSHFTTVLRTRVCSVQSCTRYFLWLSLRTRSRFVAAPSCSRLRWHLSLGRIGLRCAVILRWLQPAPFRPRAALSLAAAPSRLSDSQPPIRPIFGKCCPFSPRNGPFKIKLHREPPHLPYTKLWTRSLVGIRPTRQLVSPGSNPPSRVFKNS